VRAADLVHVHGDTSTILAPRSAETPMVWTTHGLHLLRRTSGPTRRIVLPALRAAVRASATTICSSQQEHEELVRLVDRPERLRTIVAGVPEDGSRADGGAVRSELGLGGDATVALFAAELEHRKDPLGAVEAVVTARDRGADVVLLVAGDGSLLPRVRAAAADGVHVLGFRRDLDRLMAAADVFVLPCRDARAGLQTEGLGLAVLEASASGLPVVVGRSGGSVDSVVDGTTGLLVRAEEPAEVAAALVALLRDPARARAMGRAGRRWVCATWTWERSVARLAAALRGDPDDA
jgi:phosphatidylinositol alpha-1,6-mannosyltransferase